MKLVDSIIGILIILIMPIPLNRLEMQIFPTKTYIHLSIAGGQSPIPKIQAITDMDAGVKVVEYFIRTGKRYPGIEWMC